MPTPARIKFIGRDWCGHCTSFKKTWSQISALAGPSNKKYFVADMKGPSPVGYFPSFTVDGSPDLGEDFGRHMREYETPLNERIQKAIDASNHPGYTKSLKMLLKDTTGPEEPSQAARPKKVPEITRPVGDFIGGEAGNGYGYNYGYDYQ